ncbi:formate dehydrogenase subunit delta [Novispirillum itersonii]|uniref:Formate dehydrogenase subunit delta n=1 Tax=Novispirillum itersonii TaxID=189 RepID=A0A7X0DL40_NOVIT|nr:formate dehydrogenase subunit delta [Novispirillum itersonii]MBB6209596.1 formate dehydrogenase subunit delta [Novispirillum itersonii]
MDSADLVRMANQIAGYFRAYPEDEAVAEITQHIRSFWDPRMRQGLDALIAAGGAELDPLVCKAFPPRPVSG